MLHNWNIAEDACRYCGATRMELEDNILPPECVGPAFVEMRRKAIQEEVERRFSVISEQMK